MKKISKKIVFFGTDEFSLASLRQLVEAGYIISAVVTKPDSKSGRGQKITESPVKEFAIKNNIDVWQPDNVSEIDEKIKSLGGDIIGVLVSYGKIIPKSTIDLFNPGIINLHPSILPKYRGPSPIESVIVNGDKQTGVSIMKLSSAMDAGPIYYQKIIKLSGNENRIELRKTLAIEGAQALNNVFSKIADGILLPTAQDENSATYCKLLKKDDAWLNPDEITAVEAERKVRAYLGFPKTKININGNPIIITKSHLKNSKQSILDIEFKDENILSIDELVGPSGRTMSASDFINGHSKVI